VIGLVGVGELVPEGPVAAGMLREVLHQPASAAKAALPA
jgi:hypothetical protein